MLNIRFIIKMLGMMFILETLFMLAATAVAFLYKGNDFYPLLQSSGIMFGTGVLFMLIGLRANEHTAGRREGMLTVTLTWALFSLLGMLPFYLGGYIDNVTDAYFETMSGFTTTGSTILTDIEALPHGILFWRSLTQWQGGIGVIVFTVALMPIIGGGAIQMFNAETPGITHERFRPRITQVAKRLWGVYLFLTVKLTYTAEIPKESNEIDKLPYIQISSDNPNDDTFENRLTEKPLTKADLNELGYYPVYEIGLIFTSKRSIPKDLIYVGSFTQISMPSSEIIYSDTISVPVVRPKDIESRIIERYLGHNLRQYAIYQRKQ